MASEAGSRPDLPTQPLGLTGGKTGSSTAERVTARIVRTEDGEIFTEYRIGTRTFDSVRAAEVALTNHR